MKKYKKILTLYLIVIALISIVFCYVKTWIVEYGQTWMFAILFAVIVCAAVLYDRYFLRRKMSGLPAYKRSMMSAGGLTVYLAIMILWHKLGLSSDRENLNSILFFVIV
ncbi:MAG: hypothetical protein LUF90_06270 [Rikenellaceae bacterium]|nr:hypothetical protein [Rikenellaceae bacterium]